MIPDNKTYIYAVKVQRKSTAKIFREIVFYTICILVAQWIENLPAMQETWVQYLDWKDSLEKEMATHSSILAWRIPWTEEPCRLQSIGSQESDTT